MKANLRKQHDFTLSTWWLPATSTVARFRRMRGRLGSESLATFAPYRVRLRISAAPPRRLEDARECG
jgi:hypothetical protein